MSCRKQPNEMGARLAQFVDETDMTDGRIVQLLSPAARPIKPSRHRASLPVVIGRVGRHGGMQRRCISYRVIWPSGVSPSRIPSKKFGIHLGSLPDFLRPFLGSADGQQIPISLIGSMSWSGPATLYPPTRHRGRPVLVRRPSCPAVRLGLSARVGQCRGFCRG